MMRRYKLQELLPGAEAFYGRAMGSEHLRPLLRTLGASPAVRDLGGLGEVVVLDFSGLAVATGSYLKATVLELLLAGAAAAAAGEFKDGERLIDPLNVYPVVAGLNAEIAEELDVVLRGQQEPRCCLQILEEDEGIIASARRLGPLDPVLVETLDHVAVLGRATASELHQQFPQPRPISVTAWNNRLNDLNARRLLRRVRHGRQWTYCALAREVIHG